jgi:hypothetical protein
MEALIMTNIKRKVASFVAAFAMIGAVTVPSVAKYVTDDTAIVAYAAAKSVPFKADIKANTCIYRFPSTSSMVVASVSSRTRNKAVYFISRTRDNKGYYWYFSKYDNGWIREDRIYF